MDIDQFNQQRLALNQRVRALYQSAYISGQVPALLLDAFEELQAALDVLQTVETELRQQRKELLMAVDKAKSERQRYQELFEGAPMAYFVTGVDGTIRKVNQLGVCLFRSDVKLLVGRSLTMFVPQHQRHAFRARIGEVQQGDGVRVWEQQFHDQQGDSFTVNVTVCTVRNRVGRPTSLRWLAG